MKSIERRFKQISKDNPNWSFYLCFVEAIQGQGFQKQTIVRWFNKLVDPDDYDKSEKKEIIRDLLNL